MRATSVSWGSALGMTREQVLSYADEKKIIEVPKDKDVEFFPVEERKILTLSVRRNPPDVPPGSTIEKLYAITVIFDEKYLDYFALAGSLAEKYGGYAALSPSWRKWEFEGVEIEVAKPAVVKYIALGVPRGHRFPKRTRGIRRPSEGKCSSTDCRSWVCLSAGLTLPF